MYIFPSIYKALDISAISSFHMCVSAALIEKVNSPKTLPVDGCLYTVYPCTKPLRSNGVKLRTVYTYIHHLSAPCATHTRSDCPM